MILNEDFFNDVEIKDDDLTAEEPVEEPDKEYNEKTSRELIEHKISESEMVLMIDIIDFHGQFDIWHRIECMMKRLEYMFNIYNINISEPFITYNKLSFDILIHKKIPDKKDNYIIIQHKGCNLFFPENKLREYGPDETIRDEMLELFVFLDKKIPVFKTARSAYNFLIGLDKCLWKDATKKVDFRWCESYDIDNVHKNGRTILTHSWENTYVNDYARNIFYNIIRLVPEELGKQLRKKRELLHFDDEQLKTKDIKKLIKLTEQQKTY